MTNEHVRRKIQEAIGKYDEPLPLALLLSKIMLLNTVKKSMKGPVKIFLVNQNSCEAINKLKSRGFRAASLSTHDFLHYILPCPTILSRIN